MKWIMTFLKELFRPVVLVSDARFLWLFVPASWAVMQSWEAYEAFVQTFCVVYMLVAVAHFVRKLVLPGVDLSKLAVNASEQPLSAAIAFAGVLLFLIALVVIPIWWIKPR